jgi:hypothetical protein
LRILDVNNIVIANAAENTNIDLKYDFRYFCILPLKKIKIITMANEIKNIRTVGRKPVANPRNIPEHKLYRMLVLSRISLQTL